MKSYHLIHFPTNNYLQIECNSEEELFTELYKISTDNEVLINGINYNFVSNRAHYLAAGYPLNNLTISDCLVPAHFNKHFYFIIGTTEKIS